MASCIGLEGVYGKEDRRVVFWSCPLGRSGRRAVWSSPELAKAVGEEVPLDGVLGEEKCLLVGRPRLGGTAETAQEVGARRGEVAVARELRFGREGVERGQPGVWAIGEADGDGAVKCHHRRRPYLDEQVVERDHLAPIGALPRRCLGVDRGDRRHQREAARRPAYQRL